jgi:hypothetical protein
VPHVGGKGHVPARQAWEGGLVNGKPEMERLREVWAVRAWAQAECGPCVNVYASLFDVKDHKNEAWLGHQSLMDATGLGRTALRSALADLEGAGLLQDTGKRRGRTGKVTVWEVAVALPDQLLSLRERLPTHDYSGRKRTALSRHLTSQPQPRGKPRDRDAADHWSEDRPAPDWALGEEES